MHLTEAFQVLNKHMIVCSCPGDCDDCKEIKEAREVINNMLESIRNLSKHEYSNEMNLRKAFNILTSYIPLCPRGIDCPECSRTEECNIVGEVKRAIDNTQERINGMNQFVSSFNFD